MRAIFVRHGQSTANLDVPCDDIALIQLTALGHEQAAVVAERWAEAPSLIVTSPFLRTQQTAAPTMARFVEAPVEVWPVEEFTYLEPARWNGSRAENRLPHIERYWAAAAPDHCDGAGAESFQTLIIRARTALSRLAAHGEGPIYVFSHAQFIQAVRSVVADPDLPIVERMRGFWRKGQPPAVRNAEAVAFRWDGTAWGIEASFAEASSL